ncbi:uncharacterized protein EDB91DRAFT_1243141 [Suillus paluster]|uniref:uncharacterized protein n=1 Tax=Suillus paluster TaxID=48578 RepID=UPI001B870DE4|nr:uncharacterized protein EDB91DRAFT_1243141 [Suillus paluster]KAG1752363.1 hypothetical protein EDB91DRAFT_1243141 [Suillus paluster]
MGVLLLRTYEFSLRRPLLCCSSGAIKRHRLEKIEPAISYEHFVEDLDGGDSFTTSLIEILVKEVADRHHRQNATERGLIGDRTARALRRLSNPTTTYRERYSWRGTGGRRGVDLADYLSRPPDELDMDEEADELEELEQYGLVPLEGTRVNTEMYDAYRSHTSRPNPSTAYRAFSPAFYTVPAPPPAPTPDSPSDRVLPPLLDSPPAPRLGGLTLPSASGLLHTSLTRQPSVRRPVRSRTADFSDFSARRRNSSRQPADEEGPSRMDTSSTFTGSHFSAPREDSDPPPPGPPGQARRFFPFRPRRFEVIPTPPRPAPSTGEDWLFPPVPWSSASSDRTAPSAPDSQVGEERSQAPRLRRGGLRAPESMLSRHASRPTTAEIVLRVSEQMDAIEAAEAERAEQTRSVSEEILQSIGGP